MLMQYSANLHHSDTGIYFSLLRAFSTSFPDEPWRLLAKILVAVLTVFKNPFEETVSFIKKKTKVNDLHK